MSRRPRLLLVLAMLALSLLGGASASANAAFLLTGFNDMLVDATHSHVFVTGAATDSTISVRNFDGTSAGNITGETGAGGMVLSGNTLYVARCGANEIDEIDTATLTKTGSFTAAVEAPATSPSPAVGCGIRTRPTPSSAISCRCRSTRLTPRSIPASTCTR